MIQTESRLDVADNTGARELLAQFDVRARDAYVTEGTLSSGNKQRVLLARGLSLDLTVLIASQLTRGLDVGSIEFVHRRLIEVRDPGVAVLIVSTELDEVYALADRILVMYQGRVAGIVGRDTPRDDLGMLMAGVVPAGGDTSGGAVVGEGDAGGVVSNRPAKKTKHNE